VFPAASFSRNRYVSQWRFAHGRQNVGMSSRFAELDRIGLRPVGYDSVNDDARLFRCLAHAHHFVP